MFSFAANSMKWNVLYDHMLVSAISLGTQHKYYKGNAFFAKCQMVASLDIVQTTIISPDCSTSAYKKLKGSTVLFTTAYCFTVRLQYNC